MGLDADPQARIIQGLMKGIGFIGGGAILKQGANVRGTATASSICRQLEHRYPSCMLVK